MAGGLLGSLEWRLLTVAQVAASRAKVIPPIINKGPRIVIRRPHFRETVTLPNP
jgi:hypothetical protein